MPADESNIDYQLVPLPLGQYGVDLRRPPASPALAALDNARFLDERTVSRRNGYTGVRLVDGDVFPALGGAVTPGPWQYGFGLTTPNQAEYTHYPVAGRGAGVLELNGEVSLWTGDRILTPTAGGGRALGSSTFWAESIETIGTSRPRGIPAHMPLMTDSSPPSANSAVLMYVDSALTLATEAVISTTGPFAGGSATKVMAVLRDRATGEVLSTTDITGTSTAPVTPTVIVLGGEFTVMWLDTSDNKFRVRRGTPGGWTSESTMTSDTVSAYDVSIINASTAYVAYQTGATVKTIKITAASIPTAVTRSLTKTPVTSAPAIAILAGGTALTGDILQIAYSTTDNHVAVDQLRASGTTSVLLVTAGTAPSTYLGLTACRSGELAVYYMINNLKDSDAVPMGYFVATGSGAGTVTEIGAHVANSGFSPVLQCAPASRPFSVGDETFVWVMQFGAGAGTCVLVAGATTPYCVGAADDEVAVGASGYSPGYQQPRPSADPARPDGTLITWSRTVWVSDSVTSEGQAVQVLGAVTGAIDFLPQLSVAAYGQSLYLSGSLVKNWDGRLLRDAGFHAAPVFVAAGAGGMVQGTTGDLTVGGVYDWKARAVRYNDLGERFESYAAVTPQLTLSGSNNEVTLQVFVPLCSVSAADPVTIEFYRTGNAGTTYNLEGQVVVTSWGVVSWVSTASDSQIASNEADSHNPGGEIETSAPTGCAYLAAVGDRLWGAGGQVPAGRAIFSTLMDGGFGASFDDLAGFIDFATAVEGVTTIDGLNDAVLISTATRWYVIGGTGPDNDGNGEYAAPQMTLAVGATSNAGTILTPLGVMYWSLGGPALITPNFQPQFIAAPVRSLAGTLTPVGVQIDTAREEVVWFCEGGRALLMNYATGTPRWATWSTLEIAAVSTNYLVTPDGWLLQESPEAQGDNGAPFALTIRTGNVSPQQMLSGATRLRRVGVTGGFEGPHALRLRVYYDGSPGWSDDFTWQPAAGSWLTEISDVASLTPAQVDAMTWADKSGKYRLTNRVSRQECAYLQVELTDISASGDTLLPYEIAFELGVPRAGFGRSVVQTVSRG